MASRWLQEIKSFNLKLGDVFGEHLEARDLIHATFYVVTQMLERVQEKGSKAISLEMNSMRASTVEGSQHFLKQRW